MTRPWRLTRRQRVEMEEALCELRSDFRARRWASGATARAVRVLARTSDDLAAVLFHNAEPRVTWTTAWRTVRARVALALRAALRADEDARCEEALRIAACGEVTAPDGRHDSWDAGYDLGAFEAVGAMREWRLLASFGRVPLALWERTR